MAGVTLTAVGFEAVDAALLERINAARDPAPALRQVGEYLDLSHRQRWDRGQAPDGSLWAKLRPVTLARKQAKGRPLGILVQTTDLRDTLRWALQGRELVFGTGRPYGAAMQFGAARGAFGKTKFGAPIPWGDIPPRPWLGLSDADVAEARDILRRHLEG